MNGAVWKRQGVVHMYVFIGGLYGWRSIPSRPHTCCHLVKRPAVHTSCCHCCVRLTYISILSMQSGLHTMSRKNYVSILSRLLLPIVLGHILLYTGFNVQGIFRISNTGCEPTPKGSFPPSLSFPSSSLGRMSRWRCPLSIVQIVINYWRARYLHDDLLFDLQITDALAGFTGLRRVALGTRNGR